MSFVWLRGNQKLLWIHKNKVLRRFLGRVVILAAIKPQSQVGPNAVCHSTERNHDYFAAAVSPFWLHFHNCRIATWLSSDEFIHFSIRRVIKYQIDLHVATKVHAIPMNPARLR